MELVLTPSLHILKGYFLDSFGVLKIGPHSPWASTYSYSPKDYLPPIFLFSFSVFLSNLPYFQIWEHDHLHTVTTMSIQCTTHESDKASIPIMNREWRMDPWFTTTLTSYSIAIILSFDFHVHNLHRTGPSIPQSGWSLKF